MKLLAALLAATVLFASPAYSKTRKVVAPVQSAGIITCGIWIIPANCSQSDRVIGTVLVGGAIGLGVGAVLVASGSSIVAGYTTTQATWTAGGVGAAHGLVGGALFTTQ